MTERYTHTYTHTPSHTHTCFAWIHMYCCTHVGVHAQTLSLPHRHTMSGMHYHNPDRWIDISAPPSPLASPSFLISLFISSPSLVSRSLLPTQPSLSLPYIRYLSPRWHCPPDSTRHTWVGRRVKIFPVWTAGIWSKL